MKNTAKKVVITVISVIALALSFGFGSLSNQNELKSLKNTIDTKTVKIENLTTDLENQNKNVDNVKKESDKLINQEKNKNTELTKQINILKAEKDSINNELNEAYEEIKADTAELDRLNNKVADQQKELSAQPKEQPQTENNSVTSSNDKIIETAQKVQNDDFVNVLNNLNNEMKKLDNSNYAMTSGMNTEQYQNMLLSSIENKGLTDDEKAQAKNVIIGLVETFNNIVNGTF